MNIDDVRRSIKNKRKKTKKIKVPYQNIFLKISFTILLTLVCLITLKAKPNYQKKFYQIVYEEQLEFTKLKKIYQKYLGKFLPEQLNYSNTKQVFEEKLAYEKKEKYQDGYKLTVSKSYLVPSLESGMVVFIGKKDNYNQVVIVQQIDGTDTWYGNIKNPSVKLYDYIEKGSLIGEVDKDSLYLVFKKDGKVIDGKNYL